LLDLDTQSDEGSGGKISAYVEFLIRDNYQYTLNNFAFWLSSIFAIRN